MDEKREEQQFYESLGRRKPRRFRFGIKCLFALVAICAIGFASIRVCIKHTRGYQVSQLWRGMTISEVDSALGNPSDIDDDTDGHMRSYWTWGGLDLFAWFDESGKLKGHYFAALNREPIRGFPF